MGCVALSVGLLRSTSFSCMVDRSSPFLDPTLYRVMRSFFPVIGGEDGLLWGPVKRTT